MLVLLVLLGLAVNGIIANLIGNLGKDKKIGYQTTFLVSFLLSPLIGLLMVIASVPLTEGDKKENITNSKIETDEERIKREEFEKIESDKFEIANRTKMDKMDKIVNTAMLIIASLAIFIYFTFSI